MWINLDDNEIHLIRRALSFWCESEKTIPASDGGETAKQMTALQASIEEAMEKVRANEGSAHRAAAQDRANDNLQVDDDAIVSLGDDPGCWVHAWIWISDTKAGVFHCEECGGSFATHMRGHGDCDVCEACYSAADDEPEQCDNCNAPLDEAGDGYDGKCADCADKAEANA